MKEGQAFRTRSRSPGERGVTLIELMIALAIMGILIGIAVPATRGMINSQKTRSAASDLYASLAYARSEAITQNTNVIVSPTTAGTTTWASGWSVARADVPGTPLRVQDLIAGVSISGPASVTYQRSGRLVGITCFLVTHATEAGATPRAVTVDISGRPTVRGTSC